MGLKNIPIINSIVEKEFTEELYANGFHPYKDYTTWLKLIDEEVLQTIIFMDTLVEDMSLYYVAQPIYGYLLFDYRNLKDRVVTMDNEFFRYGRFDKRIDEKHHISGIYVMEKCYQLRIQQLHRQLSIVLNRFNDYKEKADIYNYYDKGEVEWYSDVPPLVYEFAEDENVIYDKLKRRATWIDKEYYDKDEPPKKLTRNFFKSWQPMNAFAAREAIEKHDLSIYGEFLNKSKAFNLEYLRKHVPELWN